MTEQSQPTEATTPDQPDAAGTSAHAGAPASADAGTSAGAMLRAARESRGMHIAMLAATMKVTPKKLEALEADRVDELPDLAFARALTQSVCRTLKVDADPILARMPALSQPEGLEHAVNGLNTPYSATGVMASDTQRWAWLRQPVVWAAGLVLAAALAIAFAPSSWLARVNPARWLSTAPSASGASPTTGNAPRVVSEPVIGTAPAGTGAAVTTVSGTAAPAVPALTAPATTTGADGLVGPVQPAPTSTPLVETVHSAPGAPVPTTPMPEGALAAIVVRASAEAWVEVIDGKGRSLLARSVQAGETVNIDGEAPFRVRLGNASVTDLRYKGAPVEIKNRAANNTARIELK